jgi:hypothetical protein
MIDTSKIMKSNNSNEINEFLIQSIKQAAGRSIPFKNNNLKNNTRLPRYILDLINTRRKIKRKLTKEEFKNKEMWNQFYVTNKPIREEIIAVKQKNWASFVEKIGKNPLSSKDVWSRIQIIKNNGNKKADKYPILIYENKIYSTDESKANIFGELLSETFKDTDKDKYDEKFKNETDKHIEDFFKSENYHEALETINIDNLNKILKNLKSKLSCGEDKITNIMLKQLSSKFKLVLLHLCKTTLDTLVIPDLWKRVIVKMIPKKMMVKKIQRIIGRFQ